MYMVLYIPTIDPSIMYFISEDYTIVPATAGFVAWKKGITGPVNEVLFSNVPKSLLPPGQYVVGRHNPRKRLQPLLPVPDGIHHGRR